MRCVDRLRRTDVCSIDYRFLRLSQRRDSTTREYYDVMEMLLLLGRIEVLATYESLAPRPALMTVHFLYM